MKTDWSNYTIAYDGINYSVNYRDNGDLVACENYVASSPTPKNHQPLISNLPAGTYKTQDWKGDWWEFTLTEDLHGIDDVRDSVEFDKYSPAIGWQRKNYSKKMYSGSENESWLLSVGGTNTQMFQRIEYNTTPVETTECFPAYCSHAQYKNNLYNLDIVGIAGWLHASGAYYIRIRVPNEIATDVSLFKTWLAAQHTAGTPLTVVYQLATPTRTPLTFTKNNSSTAPECPMEFLTDTPSGEYPAEVFDASGTVKARGKNLFDPSIFETPRTNDGVTVQYLSNEDCLLINGVASVNASVPSPRVYINIPIVNGSRFTISTKYISGAVTRPTGSEYAVAYFGANNNINASANWQACDLLNTNSSNANLVCNYNYITAFWIYSNAGVIYDNYKVKIQLEQNTVATPYEPYRPEVTAPIPPLRSNQDGTVYDEFEVKTGKVTRKIGRIESYNGEEVGDDWISSTGALDTGATVEYVLAEPIEEQHDPVTLPTHYPTTVITTTNDTPAELTTTATVKVEDA